MSLKSTLKVQEKMLVICGLLGHFVSLPFLIWSTSLRSIVFSILVPTRSERREGGEIDTNLSPFIRYCQSYSISDKKKGEDVIDSYTGPG